MTSTARNPRVPSPALVRAVALLALATLATSGCSGGSTQETDDPPTPTTSTISATSAAGSGSSPAATGQDKAVKFAECIRSNGVPHFPDPDPDGDFTFGIDVPPAVWKKAVDACKALQPSGTLSGNRNPEQQTAALKFAQCMRDNGVKDFPDPANGEPLIDTTRIPSANRNGGMAILNATAQTCHTLLQAAAGRRP